MEYGILVLRKSIKTVSAVLRWSFDTSEGDACEHIVKLQCIIT